MAHRAAPPINCWWSPFGSVQMNRNSNPVLIILWSASKLLQIPVGLDLVLFIFILIYERRLGQVLRRPKILNV